MVEVEVDEQISASPARIWDLVGDPTRMGEFSPECRKVEWLDGATAARVGARFRGHNQLGRMRWSTVSTVVVAEPERAIAWEVGSLGKRIARWEFRIEPATGGCLLVQRFTDYRGRLLRLVGRMRAADAAEHNRRGMTETLRRLKAAAEQSRQGSGSSSS